MDSRASRLEVTEGALLEIKQWCEAYPLEVFSEPDFKAANVALKAAGISIDAMHGTWARHLLEGIGKIATSALQAEGGSPKPNHLPE